MCPNSLHQLDSSRKKPHYVFWWSPSSPAGFHLSAWANTIFYPLFLSSTHISPSSTWKETFTLVLELLTRSVFAEPVSPPRFSPHAETESQTAKKLSSAFLCEKLCECALCAFSRTLVAAVCTETYGGFFCFSATTSKGYNLGFQPASLWESLVIPIS